MELKSEDLIVELYIPDFEDATKPYHVRYGVKIEHEPTGIIVKCHETKSQMNNRAICLEKLERVLTGI